VINSSYYLEVNLLFICHRRFFLFAFYLLLLPFWRIKILSLVTRQTGRRRSNVLDLSVCLFVRLSVFSPNLWTRQFEPILAQVVHGASTWHDQLGGQEVKAQGHVKPKIDLETWWRHYPRPPGSSRYNACLQVTGFNPFPRGVYSDTTQLNSTSSCRHVHSVNNCHLPINWRSDPIASVCRSCRHKQKKHDWLGCTLFNWVSWVELSWVVVIDSRL